MTAVHVVIPFLDAPALLDACLESVAAQEDRPDNVIVCDDASTDPGVQDVIAKWWEREPTWVHRRNAENLGSLRSIVESIRAVPMHPDDAVLLVDGDDAILPHCVRTVRAILGHTGNLLTYGSYLADPPDPTCPPAMEIPEWVLRAGCYRLLCAHDRMYHNHPLSFRRCLFDALDDDDFLMPDGSWQRYGYDVALACPLVELAGTRVEFCPDVLYTYRSDRADSVARAHRDATIAENAHVITAPQKYDPMEWALGG